MTETVYTRERDLAPGAELAFELHRDSVRLLPWDRSGVRVKLLAGDPRRLDVESGRRGVRVSGRSGGAGLELEVQAPRDLRLRWVDDASTLELSGFSGRFDLTTGGRVTGRRLEGHLRLDSTGGEQRFEDLAGTVDVTCGGGTVALGVRRLTDRSSLAADRGRIDIDVPEGQGAKFTNRVWRPWHRLYFRHEMGDASVPVEVTAKRGEIRLFRDGEWKGTLRRDGEVRLAGWGERRRDFFRHLADRLASLR